jgi:hypothetical protein
LLFFKWSRGMVENTRSGTTLLAEVRLYNIVIGVPDLQDEYFPPKIVNIRYQIKKTASYLHVPQEQ